MDVVIKMTITKFPNKRTIGKNMMKNRMLKCQDIETMAFLCASFQTTLLYQQVESGEKQINLQQLVDLCNLWDISADELLFGNTTIR
jgi:hypothetical protein